MALYKRSPGGVWWVRFHCGGRLVRKSANTTDRELAEEFETALRARYWRAAKLGENVRTWKDATDRLKKTASWRDSTRKRNLYALTFFERINSVPLADVNADVTHAAREYVERTQGPASANRIMSVMRQVLNAAVEWNWITHAPPVPMAHIPERDPKWITKEQCAELVKELPPHLRAPAVFSVLTGLRMANVRDLTWDRVDLERGHLWVPSSHYKTKRAHGVSLGPEAVRLLESIGGTREGRVFLYPKPLNKWTTKLVPITGTFNTAAFRKAAKRAGLEGVRWHDLRHTFASWLASEGASDRVLQAMGGWTSPRMLTRYAHLRPDDTRPWALTLDTNAGTAVAVAIGERLVPEEGLEPPTRALRMPRARRKG